ncbi:type I-D CRISPR-associated helicase Cas3' [Methanospirillum purgamenti]|uniref:Type I-D CRISPR-associated helicase Cas3 n=1 Tax=Methanospirillum hungatei TaxID=2203 RepID=A0A8F5ZG85_METHU|nr:type I-D CRISPR-associated helicase Cas3' [Methanospirillum hungatei]QXO94214.1 type I-D CRISPR-associated helicase Cas3' [Methanospirillum hungatei]
MIIEGLSIPRYDAKPLRKSFLPYGHQVTTRAVIREKDQFFLFITAPTGAGKTESWVIPALTEDDAGVVFALYPTNALALDQYQTISSLRDKLAPQRQVEFLDADRLAMLRDEFPVRVSKGEVLTHILQKMSGQGGGIIVTNPDIFVLALKNVFIDPYVESAVRTSVKTVVFDEFHLYDLKQTDFLLFLFDDLISSDLCSIRKFIFLSATPSRGMIDKIQNVIGGELVIADEFCNEKEVDQRLILPQVEMFFVKARKFSSGEVFISRFSEFEPLLAGVRTAIIFDSAIEVAVVSEFLRVNTHYRVCEQSGFRKDSMDEPFDVLVGNKAVEVGIDFRGSYSIQQLIFSAFSVSEFLQRFGRLRNPDPEILYRAVCFAPESVCSYFSKFLQISRNQLKEGLERTMRDSRVYSSFRWRWGFLEAWDYTCHRACGQSATKIIQSREEKTFLSKTGGMSTDKREKYLVESANRILRHYFSDIGIEEGLVSLFRTPLDKAKSQVLDVMAELAPLRGNSFSVVIFYEPSQKIRAYDLFFLLRWTDIAFFKRDEFAKKVPEEYRDQIKNHQTGTLGYAYVRGMRSRPRSVRLEGRIIDQVRLPEEKRFPCRERGLFPVVKDDENGSILGLSLIEKELMKRGIFCRYLDLSAYQSRKYYELGDYAFLLPYKDGSLAIGQDAFIADCAVAESLSFEKTLPSLL